MVEGEETKLAEEKKGGSKEEAAVNSQGTERQMMDVEVQTDRAVITRLTVLDRENTHRMERESVMKNEKENDDT